MDKHMPMEGPTVLPDSEAQWDAYREIGGRVRGVEFKTTRHKEDPMYPFVYYRYSGSDRWTPFNYLSAGYDAPWEGNWHGWVADLARRGSLSAAGRTFHMFIGTNKMAYEYMATVEPAQPVEPIVHVERVL
jgi:hypothetical protein